MRLKVYKIKIYLLKIVGIPPHTNQLTYITSPSSLPNEKKIAVTISVHI